MTVVLAVFGISSYLAVRQSIDRALQERLVSARATADHLEYVLSENLNRLESISFAPGVDLEDNTLEPDKMAERQPVHNNVGARRAAGTLENRQ